MGNLMKPKIDDLVSRTILESIGNRFYANPGYNMCVQIHHKNEVILHIESTDGPYIAVTSNDRYALGLGLDFDVYQKISKDIVNMRDPNSLI